MFVFSVRGLFDIVAWEWVAAGTAGAGNPLTQSAGSLDYCTEDSIGQIPKTRLIRLYSYRSEPRPQLSAPEDECEIYGVLYQIYNSSSNP